MRCRIDLPTPLAVFLGSAPWVASVRGDDLVFAAPLASWSTTVARQPPPRFVPRFQSEVGVRAALPAILFDPRIGLQDWSNRDTATARLAALAASLEDLNAAERRDLRDQLRRAWSDALDTGQTLSATLALVVERGGGLELCRPNAADPPLIHVTSERQGFAARALGDRGEAVLDVGENDAAAIAGLIGASGGFRARLPDAGDVALIVDGQPFTPQPEDPLLAAGDLAWLVEDRDGNCERVACPRVSSAALSEGNDRRLLGFVQPGRVLHRLRRRRQSGLRFSRRHRA